MDPDKTQVFMHDNLQWKDLISYLVLFKHSGADRSTLVPLTDLQICNFELQVMGTSSFFQFPHMKRHGEA